MKVVWRGRDLSVREMCVCEMCVRPVKGPYRCMALANLGPWGPICLPWAACHRAWCWGPSFPSAHVPVCTKISWACAHLAHIFALCSYWMLPFKGPLMLWSWNINCTLWNVKGQRLDPWMSVFHGEANTFLVLNSDGLSWAEGGWLWEGKWRGDRRASVRKVNNLEKIVLIE